MFIHFVLFWQKPGTPESARTQLIEDCRSTWGRCRPSATSGPAGR